MSDELEDSERSRIRQLIRDTISQPTIGEVQEVFTHTGSESRPSNHEVSVSVPPGETPTQTFKRRPVITPSSGMVTTPQRGDLVVLLFPEQTDDPFIIGNIYGDSIETRAPTADRGDLKLIRGDASVVLTGGDPESAIELSRGDASIDVTTNSNNDSVVRLSRESASIDITTNSNDETIIELTGQSTSVAGADIGLQINADTGDIVMKNQNGHGIEIPAGGNVTIFGDKIDFDTNNSANFN
jgi:signal peptidase I